MALIKSLSIEVEVKNTRKLDFELDMDNVYLKTLDQEQPRYFASLLNSEGRRMIFELIKLDSKSFKYSMSCEDDFDTSSHVRYFIESNDGYVSKITEEEFLKVYNSLNPIK